MKRYYERIIRDSEKRIEYLLYNQILDENSPDYGAVLIDENYVEPKSTIYILTTAIALYLNENSKYYKNKSIEEGTIRGLEYVRRIQRENGLFDLLSCNFHSAPDTAFILRRLIPSYRLLQKYNGLEEVKELIYQIIINGAEGILEGGFHTPNHRWVIASMMLVVYNITGQEKYKIEATRYLNEGIDCNKDGEYAERSSGGYNVVNNTAMITMSEELGDKHYLDYVKRNLQMMLSYIEPDGSLFTNNSTRQDKGLLVYPKDYFYHYLYIGSALGINQFLNVASFIFEGILARGEKAPDCLDLLMLHEKLCTTCLGEKNELTSYKNFYQESGVVRVRKGDMSYTLLQNSGNFLFYQQGKIGISFKIVASYFSTTEFKAMELIETDNEFEMNYSSNGWYYRPFGNTPPTSDWWQMDHSKRALVRSKDLNIYVVVKEVEGGIDLIIKTNGCDRIPYNLEMAIVNGEMIESSTFACEAIKGQYIIPKTGNITIKNGLHNIAIGPAFAEHKFVNGKSNSVVRDKNCCYLYFTDFTESERVINIRGFKGLKEGILPGSYERRF